MANSLVAFAQAESAVNTGVNVTTASVSWQTDDVVVVFTGCEGGTSGETMNTPTTTGTGISFGASQQQHDSTGSDASGACWAAVATANSSGTFSGSYTHVGATGRNTVVGVYVYRGSAGIGNSAITASFPSSGRTISLTPTGADGSIAWFVADWNADAAQSFTPAATTHSSGSPGPTASPYSQQIAGRVTYYIGELDDQTSAGAVSYGIGGSGTGPFTIIAIEVKASAGGDTTPPSVPTGLHTTAVGSTTTDLAWTASTDDTAVTGYEVLVVGP